MNGTNERSDGRTDTVRVTATVPGTFMRLCEEVYGVEPERLLRLLAVHFCANPPERLTIVERRGPTPDVYAKACASAATAAEAEQPAEAQDALRHERREGR